MTRIVPSNSEDATTGLTAEAQALLESEERLRFAVEAGKMAIWEVDLETGTVTNSPELNAMFGFPLDATPSLTELRSRYAPGELEKVGRLGASWEVVKDMVAQGQLSPRPLGGRAKEEDRTQVNAELTIIVPPHITKHLLYRAQYVLSQQGRPKITGFLIDMTEKKLAEQQLAIVAGELRHRVKNSFTVVQALARQTFRQAPTPEAALDSYLGRLQALALANDLVLETDAGAADLKTVAEKITAPYRLGRPNAFVFEGPTIGIAGPQVTGLSMVLHELCTNALKYGALSRPDGQISLSWTTSNDSQIILNWAERGGPKVEAPERQGFGSRLLTRMVEDTLSGSLDVHYHPDGIRCRITIGPAGISKA